jgi:hypothetical protein
MDSGDQKLRLDAYHDALREYARFLRGLNDRRGTAQAEEYRELLKQLDDAHQHAEAARHEVESGELP